MGPDMVYTMLKLDGKDVGGLYKLMPDMVAQGVPPHWLSYVAVTNADETGRKSKSRRRDDDEWTVRRSYSWANGRDSGSDRRRFRDLAGERSQRLRSLESAQLVLLERARHKRYRKRQVSFIRTCLVGPAESFA